MSRQAPVEIIRTGLRDHPAVRAWNDLRPARAEPESIHVVREGNKAAIYRLTGLGSARAAVIAKRCLPATASVERAVYEDILPHVPVSAPRYYGSIDDGAFCWLFLEDVGEQRYSALSAEHCALAGRWLGLMHTSAARVAAAACLPDAGPGRYLEHLRSTRRTILPNLTNPALTAEDRAALQTILAQYACLESRWSQVVDSCEGAPSTLVHGDFRPKNAYVRSDRSGACLFPIDWETAGWGAPAADLPRVDLAAYWSVVRERWPGLDAQAIQRLANVGRLFQLLAAISWESRSLRFYTRDVSRWPNMRLYQTALVDVIQAAGLAH